DVLIQLKRKRIAAVQNLELLAQQLNLAGIETGVHGAGRGGARSTLDLQHELIAPPLGLSEYLSRIRVEYDLQYSGSVTQIDKNDPAMIAASLCPAGDRNGLINKLA